MRERLLAANAQITWMPDHLKAGRFGKWLENARDWAVSRNRYWGCPLPLWRNEDGSETVCVGSLAELEERCGHSVPDIHKHHVDQIVLRGKDGAELRRIPEVLDCWFESGSMPYAQRHYPFEHKQWLEDHFPADFIAEGLDQTRGWFYTLVVLGAALFDKPSFRNVVVNGLILAEDGRKMSKRLKNYPDPETVMDQYGADALRLYLLASPVVRAEDLCFTENGVRETMRTVLLPLWHAYSFLVTYAQVDGWQPPAGGAAPGVPANALDRWVRSRLEGLVRDLRADLDRYDLQAAASRFAPFLDHLTNWYIRRSRRRFWKSQDDQDKAEAYATLYHVLVTFCQAAAPVIPFLTESIYRNLRQDGMPESVHLCDYPAADLACTDAALDRRMARAMTAVSLGRFLRSQATVRVRQPLPAAVLVSHGADVRADLEAMRDVIAEELNVKTVRVEADEEALVQLSAKANFRRLGPRLGKHMKTAAAAIAALDAAALRTLRQQGTLTLTVVGLEPLTLAPDDIEVRREERQGLAVANEGDITVALELTLAPALVNEGWARELVHVLQNLRKEGGLDVADRVRVQADLPPPLAAVAREFAEYIAGETLAVSFDVTPLADCQPVKIGEWDCKFAVAKVG